MKQPIPSRPYLELSDPEAARVVTDTKARRYLEPFIGQERSVSQLAQELSVHISSADYRVKQFLRLGLVEQTRLERRRGRAVKYYSAVAEGFYVPFSATSHATTETLSPNAFENLQARLNKSIAEAWTRAAGEPRALGIHLYRADNGAPSQNITTYPDADEPTRFFEALCEAGAPAVWDTWGSRRLSPENAKRLQRELASMLQRYPPDDAPGNEAYIVRLAIAPLVGSSN